MAKVIQIDALLGVSRDADGIYWLHGLDNGTGQQGMIQIANPDNEKSIGRAVVCERIDSILEANGVPRQ